tara:strand:- start:617 stop:1009 length:393 start_codon:yes stop_codon:yes gene_type:complete
MTQERINKMKITNEELRTIIQEEIESAVDEGLMDKIKGAAGKVGKALGMGKSGKDALSAEDYMQKAKQNPRIYDDLYNAAMGDESLNKFVSPKHALNVLMSTFKKLSKEQQVMAISDTLKELAQDGKLGE